MKRLKGVVCATITPMNSDGTVDYESAEKLYRYLGEKGVHCLYLNGTNGESLSLTHEEKCRLADVCVSVNQGCCAVYLQCGAGTVEETITNVKYATTSGADGVGIMTPVFFPVDPDGLEDYYNHTVDATGGLPCYVYNIPSRTGNDVPAVLLGKLMQRFANLYGVKYSAPDLLRIEQYVNCCAGREVDVLIGCDRLALPCMDVGGAGWVSGPAAVFAECFTRLYSQIVHNDVIGARKTQAWIVKLSEKMAGVPEVPAIKYMLVKRGIIRNDTCRAPFRTLTDDERQRLDALLNEYFNEEQL